MPAQPKKPLQVEWVPSQTEEWALDPGEYDGVLASLPSLTEEQWDQLGKENTNDPAWQEQKAWAAKQENLSR